MRHQAFLALSQVVFGQFHNRAGQQNDSNQVDGGHQPHGCVRRIEYRDHRFVATPDHHAQRSEPQQGQAQSVAAAQVDQSVLGVGVVGDNGGEGEEQNRDGDKVAPELTQVYFHGLLGQLGAGHTGTRLQNACQQDHHGRRRTDNDGIDKDTECLNQTL